MQIQNYTPALHTGHSYWDSRIGGLTGGKIWITCNGKAVDLRDLGYPRAYVTSTYSASEILRILSNQEMRALYRGALSGRIK